MNPAGSKRGALESGQSVPRYAPRKRPAMDDDDMIEDFDLDPPDEEDDPGMDLEVRGA